VLSPCHPTFRTGGASRRTKPSLLRSLGRRTPLGALFCRFFWQERGLDAGQAYTKGTVKKRKPELEPGVRRRLAPISIAFLPGKPRTKRGGSLSPRAARRAPDVHERRRAYRRRRPRPLCGANLGASMIGIPRGRWRRVRKKGLRLGDRLRPGDRLRLLSPFAWFAYVENNNPTTENHPRQTYKESGLRLPCFDPGELVFAERLQGGVAARRDDRLRHGPRHRERRSSDYPRVQDDGVAGTPIGRCCSRHPDRTVRSPRSNSPERLLCTHGFRRREPRPSPMGTNSGRRPAVRAREGGSKTRTSTALRPQIAPRGGNGGYLPRKRPHRCKTGGRR
jgi:hypothetical protein